MATSIKISQLPAKGSNLEATDLLEISEFNGTGYLTKSITGAEIVASVPPTSVDWGDIGGTLSAQTDLNTALNGKQATVTLTTTGTSGASTFVANTLNVPTYSLSGLGGVPTTRTLTINGTTQDLSADRTFTVSTGITIGTTAITSGTVGRVLFEGTGNVVQESANLFWDNTNRRLGIGTSSPAGNIDINANFATTGYPLIVKNTGYFNAFFQGTSANNQASFYLENDRGSTLSYGGFAIGGSTSTLGNIFGLTRPDRLFMFADGTNNVGYAIGTLQNVPLQFGTNNAIRATVFGNGNIGIGTTTDAGFKLDVNGTARVQTSFLLGSSLINANTTAFPLQVNFTNAASNVGAIWRNGSSTGYASFRFYNNINDGGRALEMGYSGSAFSGSIISGGIAGESAYITTTGAYPLQFGSNNLTRFIIASSGNLLINTTTDVASSKLTIESTSQGFLPPRMTTTQKNAIASPATGLVVFDLTLNKLCVRGASAWETITSL